MLNNIHHLKMTLDRLKKITKCWQSFHWKRKSYWTLLTLLLRVIQYPVSNIPRNTDDNYKVIYKQLQLVLHKKAHQGNLRTFVSMFLTTFEIIAENIRSYLIISGFV